MVARMVTSGHSALDSARFDRGIARVTVPAGVEVDVHEVVDEIEKQAADVCILRYPARHQTWFAEFARMPHEVLLADSLVYWSLRPGSGNRPARQANTAVREGVGEENLDDLVAEVFSGYRNHYAANPAFPTHLALAGYQDWAGRSLDRGDLLSLWMDDEVVGFATHELSDGVAEILLAGVAGRHQGQGLYAHLLAGEEALAIESGAESLVISTQGHNTKVQRTWARYGFEPVESFLTVHVMRRGWR
jgi:ribosomal protein S18 acetylase RimI-like enzyme